jgi:hypothetical protein
MPTPTGSRFGRSSAVSRLYPGQNALPRIASEEWQPVVLVGTAATLSGEPFEARGISAPDQGPIAGSFSAVEIHAIAPGGIVVERLSFRSAVNVFLTRSPLGSVFGQFGAMLAAIVDVGGEPVRSQVAAVARAFAPTEGIEIDATSFPVLERIWIPGGSFLSLISSAGNQALVAFLLWREISDASG